MIKETTRAIAFKMKISYISAGFTILLGIMTVYWYSKASSDHLFSTHFHSYHMQVLRGASDYSSIKDAYGKGKMDSVISEFRNKNTPQPEEYLITGIAYLEKKQPKKAIETFQLLIEKNKKSNTDFFQDDAEYYLAMSYLSSHEMQKALPIFEKIQLNPEHKYNSDVSEWFSMNVKSSLAKQ